MTAQDYNIKKKAEFIDYINNNNLDSFHFIGIDRSLTSTGLAVTKAGKYISGREIKPKTYGAIRLGYIVKEILCEVKKYSNPIVIMEDYAFGRPEKAVYMGEIGGVTKLFLEMKKIKYAEISPHSLKKYVVGAGNVKKEMVPMFVYKKFGITPSGHDIADAIGLSFFGYNCFKSINNLDGYNQKEKEVFSKFLANERKIKNKKSVRHLTSGVDD